jgi:predicted ATPase/DNA-binding winged helix-turn-helix (wHTH) protein
VNLDAFVFQDFEVRLDTRQLLVRGEPARLGARAFDLLVALVERRDRVVGKDELLDLVWPGLVVEENNLQVHISALRRLLGAGAIATVPGRGYQFAVAIEASHRVADAAAPPHTAAPGGASAGNLARALPRLFGRDDDLASVIDLVKRQPLVTVVGAPGLGKTALALAAADALRQQWSDGAWVVELANVADPAQVASTVAQALRITMNGKRAPLDELAGVLESQSLLLVLDNCEHLVDAAGEFAESTLRRAPGVRILATSQELLNVPGEALYKLKPLAVPEPGELDRADQYGAFRLFMERAGAADPHLYLSPGNAEAVADICRRLDGLPLAIELAAARVRLLGVRGVRDRLGERFKVLTAGARTAMRRHQTLLAAIDWSHGLLAPGEQRVLRRLGVFVGGFSIELAQDVAADQGQDAWEVIDALGTLVDRSLVSVEAGEPPRYRLLETTRAYALEKLAGVGETAQLVERHARAVERLFVRFGEERYGESGSLGMYPFMQRLVPELDNLRAALGWAAADGGDAVLAISLAGASAELYRTLGISEELLVTMRGLLDVVERSPDDLTVAIFLTGMTMLGSIGRESSERQLKADLRAEQILRALGSRRRLYYSLYGQGWDHMSSGNFDEAMRLLADMETLEKPTWPAWMRALRLNLHGCIGMNQGRHDEGLPLLLEQYELLKGEAEESGRRATCIVNICAILGSMRRFEEVLEYARLAGEVGDGVNDPFNRGYRGYIDWMRIGALTFLGRLEQADRVMREAMPGWRRDGLLPVCLGMLAMLMAERQRWEAAARLTAAALAFWERRGVKAYEYLRLALERAQSLLAAAALDPQDLERWRREGAEMDDAALAALCLETPVLA